MRQRVTFRQTEANCTTNCPKLVQIGNVAVCNEAGIGHFARYSARYSTAELAILWSISTDVYVSKDQYLCTGMSCPRTGWNILLGLHIIQLTQMALFVQKASTGSVRVTEFPLASHCLPGLHAVYEQESLWGFGRYQVTPVLWLYTGACISVCSYNLKLGQL